MLDEHCRSVDGGERIVRGRHVGPCREHLARRDEEFGAERSDRCVADGLDTPHPEER